MAEEALRPLNGHVEARWGRAAASHLKGKSIIEWPQHPNALNLRLIETASRALHVTLVIPGVAVHDGCKKSHYTFRGFTVID